MTLSISDEVRKIVREKLQYNPVQLPKHMEYVDQEDKHRVKSAPIHVYIYAMYQAILDLGPDVHFRDGAPFSESKMIFSMVHTYPHEASCAFKIKFLVDEAAAAADCQGQLTLSFGEMEATASFPEVSPFPWLQQFIRLVEQCPFRLIAIPLALRMNSEANGHRNLLVVLKLRPDKFIVLTYDPHGYESATTKAIARDQLLAYMKQNMPRKYVWMPLETTTCPQGLQARARDRVGYCVMFSNFWFYCLLRCFHLLLNQTHRVKQFQQAVLSIESTILEEVNAQSLMMVITNFAVQFCEHFWTSVQLTPDQMRDYDRLMYEHIKSDASLLPKGHKSMSRSSLYLSDSPRNYTEEKMRADDGEKCQSNADCQSHCCHSDKRICVAVNFNMEGDAPLTPMEDFLVMISPLFDREDFELTATDLEKGLSFFKLWESCMRTPDHPSLVYELILFFLPRNRVHQMCNGTIHFVPRLLSIFKHADRPEELFSIDSTSDMRDLVGQMLHRQAFAGPFSFFCVDRSRSPDSLPYHLIYIGMNQHDQSLQLFSFNFQDSIEYLSPVDQLGRRIVDAMQAVHSAPVGWRGMVEIPLDSIHPSLRQTAKHMIQGLAIMFFAHFSSKYSVVEDVIMDFQRVWSKCCEHEEAVLQQAVCRFAVDLMDQQEKLDRRCLSALLG